MTLNDDFTFAPMLSDDQPNTADAPALGGEFAQYQYYGIADCHGLHCLIDAADAPVGIMVIKANANAQRFEMVIGARLLDEDVQTIRWLIEHHQQRTALLWLKTEAITIGAAGVCRRQFHRIPNDELDPFG